MNIIKVSTDLWAQKFENSNLYISKNSLLLH